ncbi:TIGR01458 family HAD-type hydrolase [Pseudothauera rhizosphaerae]|uniref:Haloacid dehalogenase-like hydrolase domain-containing protein 2 n=1 Tax=Pseudothauera rhizosphaerae TaxID=2565932 RepID=A0A4S4AS98_9RHOO|nr:TIGR01458 family HAD-type hydrolase [Pseudothauera rhizosphaerae]THF62692.1 TIGR01458 family HAD-type hydrolase [Pseudothauera rhizosphaerae]
MQVQALFFDLSGVIYSGVQPIPGVVERVNALRARGFAVRFLTNTASQSRDYLLALLAGMGVEVAHDELFTAPGAAAQWVRSRGHRPYLLLSPNVAHEFDGIPRDDPDCVVLGDAGDDLSYANLNRAFELVLAGATLVGIGYNRYYHDGEGIKLDAGAFVHALEWAAGRQAVIMGKPSAAFFAEVVRSTGLQPAQCLMVGDDVFGDIEGALQAGLQACLVRTGKYRPGDEGRIEGDFRVLASAAGLEP